MTHVLAQVHGFVARIEQNLLHVDDHNEAGKGLCNTLGFN